MSGQTKSATRQYFGWGLMLLGALVVVGAAVVWLITRAPDQVAVRQLPTPTALATAAEVGPLVVPSAVIPTPLATPAVQQLPSVARLDEAPTNLYERVPQQPQRLVIPSLGVDAPVRDVGLSSVYDPEQGADIFYQWQVPQLYAAGWHHNSAPLGRTGNTVLNGHQNVYGEVFRDLEQLVVGDGLIMYDVEGNSYVYEVTEKEIMPEQDQSDEVRAANARWIQPTLDERVTLVTCWPYTSNSHRLVIVAKPVRLPRS